MADEAPAAVKKRGYWTSEIRFRTFVGPLGFPLLHSLLYLIHLRMSHLFGKLRLPRFLLPLRGSKTQSEIGGNIAARNAPFFRIQPPKTILRVGVSQLSNLRYPRKGLHVVAHNLWLRRQSSPSAYGASG